MIKPTEGRVVWFYKEHGQARPMTALIAYVHSDTMVNLAVSDFNGNMTGATSVYLVQENSEIPGYPYCTWMPYQKGQAAKTEALEKKLSGEGLPDQAAK